MFHRKSERSERRASEASAIWAGVDCRTVLIGPPGVDCRAPPRPRPPRLIRHGLRRNSWCRPCPAGRAGRRAGRRAGWPAGRASWAGGLVGSWAGRAARRPRRPSWHARGPARRAGWAGGIVASWAGGLVGRRPRGLVGRRPGRPAGGRAVAGRTAAPCRLLAPGGRPPSLLPRARLPPSIPLRLCPLRHGANPPSRRYDSTNRGAKGLSVSCRSCTH